MKHPKRRRLALVLFPLSLAFCVLLSHDAYAQTVVPPATSLLSTSALIILVLGGVGGYLSHSIQTGTLFGAITIPKPWLPWVTLLGTFLLAFAASLQLNSSGGITELGLLNATAMGFLALLGNTVGVTARQQIVAHLRDRTPLPPIHGSGSKIDAVNKAANEVTSPGTIPPAAQRTAYRTNARTAVPVRTPFPRWITRTALATAILAISMTATTAMVETGCSNNVPTPQTQAEIAASEALGVCIEQEYVTDASKTPPPAALQIALDIASTCGAEAVDVVGAFTTPSSAPAATPVPSRSDVATVAQANAPALHVAAMNFHQKHGS